MKKTVPVLLSAVLLSRSYDVYAKNEAPEDRNNTTINAPVAVRVEPESEGSQNALGGIVQDWFPDPLEQTACYALYAPPVFNTNKLNASFSEQETTIKAEEGTLLQHGQSTLIGNVVISQPNRNLEASRVHLFKDDNGELVSADAYSHVLFEEPDYRMVGDQAHVAFATNDFRIHDAEFRSYAQHGRGFAKLITRHDKDPVHMSDVSYTTCPPGDNLWELRANELTLNQQTEQGDAYHTWVYVKGVPVAYTPWISFPISSKRKSGILKPTFGESNRSGYEFRLPYYWDLAPNYDATITPLYQSKRGLHLHGEQRYLWSHGEGHLLAEIQPHDRELAALKKANLLSNTHDLSSNDPRLINLEKANLDRRAIAWNHRWNLTDQWLFNTDFQWASDDNYFADLDSDIGPLNYRNLHRQAQLQYQGENLNLRTQVEDYQILQPLNGTLNTTPYRMLPEVDAQYLLPDVANHFDLELPLNFVQYEHGVDPLTHIKPPTGTRYDVGPAIKYNLRYPYGFFAPRFELHHTEYNLDNPIGNKPHLDRTLPITSIDGGLYFERDTQWLNEGFVQTLEPRLFYLYTPYVNQNNMPNFDSGLTTFSFAQLFQHNRFSGHDRIGDANQLSYSLLSRWLTDENGDEKARISMGQIAFFEKRRVTVCNSLTDGATPTCLATDDPLTENKFSDLITEGKYHLNDRLNLYGDLFWNTNNNSLQSYSARLEWQQSIDRIFNFRYNAIRGTDQTNQVSTDTSFVWRFTPRWRIVTRWNYDWSDNLVIDEFGSIEYENCCWAIRTGARGTLNLNDGLHKTKDQQYFVQWVFKGLTGFGEGFSDQQGPSIPGYRDNFATTY